MRKKVKAIGLKNNSTLKRMELGGFMGTDPGNILSSTKTSNMEDAKQRAEAKAQGVGKTIGLSLAGATLGGLSVVPGLGTALDPLQEKVKEADKTGIAGIVGGIAETGAGVTAAVMTGGTMGTSNIASGLGETMEGGAEVAANKGNKKASDRLSTASSTFNAIAPIAGAASGMMNPTAMMSALPIPEMKKGGRVPTEVNHIPDEGKIVNGPSHEQNGVLTTVDNKEVAEVEGKEAMTSDGKVFSASLKSMSNPKKTYAELYKKVQKLETITPEGENTKKLAEEALFIEQEKSKELLQIENEKNMAKYGKKLNLPKYAKGGGVSAVIGGVGAIKTEDAGNQNIGLPSTTEVPDPFTIFISPTGETVQEPFKLKFPIDTSTLLNPGITDGRFRDTNRPSSIPEKTEENKEDITKKGTLTPGDITQLSGNLIAPLANLAAAKGIEKDTLTFGKDRFTPREQRISTADMERATRQEAAATRAGVQAMGAAGDAVKGSISTAAAQSLQNAMFTAESKNKDLALTFDQIIGQNNKFNIGQDDKTKLDARDRRDLGRTTRLTAAEQAGKAVVDLGAFKNQGLTNSVELKALQEAYPDYGINASNIKEFYKIALSGDEKELTKFKRKNGGTK